MCHLWIGMVRFFKNNVKIYVKAGVEAGFEKIFLFNKFVYNSTEEKCLKKLLTQY